MCRGCVALKKKPSGGTLRAKTGALLTSGPSGPEARAARLFNFWTSPVSNEPCRARQWAQGRIFLSSARAIARQESFRVISTARLRTLPPVHLPPIYVVVCNDPNGDLILRLASCLDAFSTYPYPTRLPGRAPGGTTGGPEVGPTRSSRTSVRATQISNAHNR